MKIGKTFFIAACLGIISASYAFATVNDALSFAYEAAEPYAKQGYSIREDAWGGDLGVGDQKAVMAQLFKGNDYWFFAATDARSAVLTIAIYNAEGSLVQSNAWQKGKFSAASVTPAKTGTYYIIVTVVKSSLERTPWSLVYGYK